MGSPQTRAEVLKYDIIYTTNKISYIYINMTFTIHNLNILTYVIIHGAKTRATITNVLSYLFL